MMTFLIDKPMGSAETAGDAERLRQFAAWAIRIAWRGEDIDGGDLQEKAAELGLLNPVERVTPCHADCQCAEVYGWNAEITCYRFTEILDPDAEPNEGTTIKDGLDEIREKFGRYFSD